MANTGIVPNNPANSLDWVTGRSAHLATLTPTFDDTPDTTAAPGGRVHTFHGMTPASAARMVERIDTRRDLSATAEQTTTTAPIPATAVEIPLLRPVSNDEDPPGYNPLEWKLNDDWSRSERDEMREDYFGSPDITGPIPEDWQDLWRSDSEAAKQQAQEQRRESTENSKSAEDDNSSSGSGGNSSPGTGSVPAKPSQSSPSAPSSPGGAADTPAQASPTPAKEEQGQQSDGQESDESATVVPSTLLDMPDTTGRSPGDVWTGRLLDGRTVQYSIPEGNGNNTVDLRIENPGGKPDHWRIASDGNGQLQHWHDDGDGNSSYGIQASAESDWEISSWDPGTSTSDAPDSRTRGSADLSLVGSDVYDEDGTYLGTNTGVLNEDTGLYDNVFTDTEGNILGTRTVNTADGGYASVPVTQLDSNGIGWQIDDQDFRHETILEGSNRVATVHDPSGVLVDSKIFDPDGNLLSSFERRGDFTLVGHRDTDGELAYAFEQRRDDDTTIRGEVENLPDGGTRLTYEDGEVVEYDRDGNETGRHDPSRGAWDTVWDTTKSVGRLVLDGLTFPIEGISTGLHQMSSARAGIDASGRAVLVIPASSREENLTSRAIIDTTSSAVSGFGSWAADAASIVNPYPLAPAALNPMDPAAAAAAAAHRQRGRDAIATAVDLTVVPVGEALVVLGDTAYNLTFAHIRAGFYTRVTPYGTIYTPDLRRPQHSPADIALAAITVATLSFPATTAQRTAATAIGRHAAHTALARGATTEQAITIGRNAARANLARRSHTPPPKPPQHPKPQPPRRTQTPSHRNEPVAVPYAGHGKPPRPNTAATLPDRQPSSSRSVAVRAAVEAELAWWADIPARAAKNLGRLPILDDIARLGIPQPALAGPRSAQRTSSWTPTAIFRSRSGDDVGRTDKPSGSTREPQTADEYYEQLAKQQKERRKREIAEAYASQNEKEKIAAADNPKGDSPDYTRQKAEDRNDRSSKWNSEKMDKISRENIPNLDDVKFTHMSATHTIHGDPGKLDGGGHMYGTGNPDKTEFPIEWNERDIFEMADDLVKTTRDGDRKPVWQPKRGSWLVKGWRTHKGRRVLFEAYVQKKDDVILSAAPKGGDGVTKNDGQGRKIPGWDPYSGL
ncbi:hypothetical protein [Nocardia sp. CNY236]|uniref:hypothetical protein n=1 Tax=Nocardia sp. CNY236 TaxID=1169152 RepID=UPI0012DF9C03|nr:hypothetical protein [Nocardia sp. CNY236]